jgi:hypothetical protein
MPYKNCYIKFCYLIHPNGMIDTAFICTRATFLGIPYGYSSSFFSDDLIVHRNILAYITKQQHILFI